MTSTKHGPESEWTTRKRRIDPRLDTAGWSLRAGPPSPGPFRTEEHSTQNGPADDALWLANRVVGIVEAKKLTLGPQNVLTQAERYARGLDPAEAPGNHGGLRAPFLYATNGEVTVPKAEERRAEGETRLPPRDEGGGRRDDGLPRRDEGGGGRDDGCPRAYRHAKRRRR